MLYLLQLLLLWKVMLQFVAAVVVVVEAVEWKYR